MNVALQNRVIAPPIPAFKIKAKEIKPLNGQYFDMTQAVPSFPTFMKIREVVSAEAKREAVSFYTDVPGIFPLREEIVAQHPLATTIDTENVLITSGANHAMYTAMTTLFNSGDKVALIEPYYFNYDMALKMMGMEPSYYVASERNSFSLDAEHLIAWAKNEKVKGIVLITPNNPTGALYSSSEILKLLRWAASENIEVILDETYLVFDRNHLNNSEIGKFIDKNLSIVGSFSKSFSLTGYRVGYLITSKSTLDEVNKVQDTMVICPSHIGQLAALVGLKECQTDVKDRVAAMRNLEELFIDKSKHLKRFKLSSVGAYFAFLRHPYENICGEDAALRLYRETGILSMPGTIFGEKQDRFMRLAFCNVDKMKLERALDILIDHDASL